MKRAMLVICTVVHYGQRYIIILNFLALLIVLLLIQYTQRYFIILNLSLNRCVRCCWCVRYCWCVRCRRRCDCRCCRSIACRSQRYIIIRYLDACYRCALAYALAFALTG